MSRGIITKIRRELFYVTTENQTVMCKARGNFRKREITPIVGDYVDIRTENGLGYIEKIYPRKNALLRPPVANIDIVVILMSIKQPDINLMLLDKYLLMVEKSGIQPVIVFNKEDLLTNDLKEQYQSIYNNLGYPVLMHHNPSDNKMLRDLLFGKVSAVAGPSGAGKSTTLRSLYHNLIFISGEISEKTKRGKQTTRHIEMVEVDKDTFVLDTPGFSGLDLRFLDSEYEIKNYYPEFRNLPSCKFHNCIHIDEPSCQVKKRVETGEIAKTRYENYCYFVNEFKQNRRY